MRRGLEWDAREVHTEFLRHAQVHLVIHQPHCDLRDLCRKLFDFDAEELIHVHVDFLVDVEKTRSRPFMYGAQHFQFQLAQFAVGDHQKVAAAAGGIEEGQCAQFFVELEQFVFVAAHAVEFFP